MEEYDESDFVEYAFMQMGIPVLKRQGKYFDLVGGFSVEVERKDLYRLSADGWVISPFDDIGNMINFLKKNLSAHDKI
jgi:hypothetical protein